jgi:predicted O-methyltransferase YrrM
MPATRHEASPSTIMKRLVKSFFGLQPKPQPPSLIKPVDLVEAVGELKPDIKILEARSTNGNVSVFEVFALNVIAAAMAPKSIFEIGTFDGRTTLNLAANCPADSKIVTLDLPAAKLGQTRFELEDYDKSYVIKPASGQRFHGKPEAEKITQIFGDSGTFDFAPYHNSFDFIFIDGSHAYEYVLHDSHTALKLLRSKKGVIVWHDFGHPCWPGVLKALNELVQTKDFGGIRHIADTHIACQFFR